MSGRGQFKYICDDCKAVNWLTARERSSRFIPKCIECGSTWLEPSHGSKGPAKIGEAQAAAKENIVLQNRKMGKNDEKDS